MSSQDITFTVRISSETLTEAKRQAWLKPEQFDNVSHYIRIAVIEKNRRELERGMSYVA